MKEGSADGPKPGACLSEEQVLAFMEGRVDLGACPSLELHLDGCEACFEWVARLVRASFLNSRPGLADTVPSTEPIESVGGLAPLRLLPGESIGRYQIVSRLGEGSMGVVYRAHDPVLQREVALKLIRSARPTAGSRVRALREAQALAKLKHPNVVTVHDLGFVGDQVFVAMELVEGETLAAWLRRQRPGWRHVRDRFVQAGRGLAAAHAAGLVHGDFKPENVLVSDQRVVVTDFGLVRSVDVEDPIGPARRLAGTPAYMSPEQFEGGPIDAHADVFNFCAAMYEAVFGQPAFEGDRFDERRAAVIAGRLRRPRLESRAPGWLRGALLRGLEHDPGRRPASMEKLLVALESDRRLQRRILMFGGAVIALTLAVLSAAVLSYRSPLAGCERRALAARALGSSTVEQRIRDAFVKTGTPGAARTAETAVRILRQYIDAWSSAYTATCGATYREGAQSLEAFDLRVGCLDARHAELSKLVNLFQSADARVVERAVTAASEIDPIATCADPLLLRGAVPPPSTAKSRIESVRHQLAETRSLELVGKFEDAERLVDAALERARAVAYPPLEAEAWLRKGFVARYRGREADSERAFRSAFDAAERGGADRERALAAVELVEVVGHRQGRVNEGQQWANQAEAILARLGHPVDDEAALAMNRGLLHETEGKLDKAEPELLEAYELRKKGLSPDNPLVWLTLANLATVADGRGEYDKAERMYREAHTRLKVLLGPTHRDALVVQGNVAGIAYSLGHYREAKRQWEEVLTLENEQLGQQHPEAARTLYNIASAEACVGEYAEAIRHAQRALSTVLSSNPEDLLVPKIELSLAIYLSSEGQSAKARALAMDALGRRKAKLGDSDPLVGAAEYQLARLDLDIHRPLDARVHAERALTLVEHGYGEMHSRVADVLDVLGIIERELGHLPAAVARHERALKIRTALGASSDLPDTLSNLGLAQLLSGRTVEARATLERAQQLRQTIESDPAARALTAFALARTLGRPVGERGRTLAASALTQYVASGPRFTREAQEVRSWLKSVNP